MDVIYITDGTILKYCMCQITIYNSHTFVSVILPYIWIVLGRGGDLGGKLTRINPLSQSCYIYRHRHCQSAETSLLPSVNRNCLITERFARKIHTPLQRTQRWNGRLTGLLSLGLRDRQITHKVWRHEIRESRLIVPQNFDPSKIQAAMIFGFFLSQIVAVTSDVLWSAAL